MYGSMRTRAACSSWIRIPAHRGAAPGAPAAAGVGQPSGARCGGGPPTAPAAAPAGRGGGCHGLPAPTAAAVQGRAGWRAQPQGARYSCAADAA